MKRDGATSRNGDKESGFRLIEFAFPFLMYRFASLFYLLATIISPYNECLQLSVCLPLESVRFEESQTCETVATSDIVSPRSRIHVSY